MTKHLLPAMLACALMAACGGSKPQPQPPPQPKATAPAAATANDPMRVSVIVLGLDGKPLDNMIPIAAAQPNAFDKPVAQGPPTNMEGKAEFSVPGDRKLFIRAWDPSLQMFGNNYLELAPEPGTRTDLLKLTMVPGASLDAVLLLPDKTPAANTDVAIMMFHPTEGPWWPDKGRTDANGAMHFPALPAGQFGLRIKTSAGSAEVPSVNLPPMGKANLGNIILN